MAKLKVTLKLDKRLDPSLLFNSKFHDRVGLQVVMKMRDFIARGISPVKGFGRFEAYAAQRNSATVREFSRTQSKDNRGYYRKLAKKTKEVSYPNSVKDKFPGKQMRPVNLYLDGTFLDTLGYKSNRYSVSVGHMDTSKKTKNLFEAHNEGLNKNVPMRRYLPNKKNEEFVATIMSMIKSIYSERIKYVLGLINK